MVAQVDAYYFKLRPLKWLQRFLCYAFFEGRPLTTKGRWFNKVVFALFSIQKRLDVKVKITKPIFIIGTGRSGTTVLGVVLSMHREVCFLNEPKAIWYSAYSGEDVVGNYTRQAARYRLSKEDLDSRAIVTVRRLYKWCLALTRTTRVVDKYPELIFRLDYVRGIFPDAKFLFLVRNGWDTCHSIENWSRRLGKQAGVETHDWWGADNRKWKLLVEQIVTNAPCLARLAA